MFRETQKKLPINDDALTKNYHSVEKLEDFLKFLLSKNLKKNKKWIRLKIQNQYSIHYY